MPEPVIIATWPFGRIAVEKAQKQLAAGMPLLDALIEGATDVENDLTVRSVGFGSVADKIGRLTLDACVMDGKTLACGAVAAVEHIRSVAKLAKLVMDKTPHIQVFGEGAKWFALQNGMPLEMPHTVESIRAWFENNPEKFKKENRKERPINATNHDTVTVLGVDDKGHMAGVCTTSGLSYKLPGRVGDSPIIGAGLYVDDEVGGAGGTGVGEEIIRLGGSSFIMEQLRLGKTPQEATEIACQRHVKIAARQGKHPREVCFLCLDPKGRIGASTTGKNFEYAVGRGGKIEMMKAKELNVTSD